MHSVNSYPVRGPWGNASYPGNCTGHLLIDLIRFYRPRSVADPAEGSGTSRDVCKELSVPYYGFDLREGFNLGVTPLVAVLPSPVDLVFFHPPYYRIVPYSGKVWGKEPNPADLSHEESWGRYLFRLMHMVEHARTALTESGHLAVLIGDVRQAGSYYSAQAAFFRWFQPHEIDSLIIKTQHNVRSEGKDYARPLIRIMHEYCLVLRAARRGGSHG